MSGPTHFDRYRVLGVQGSGEMGTVYLAEDPSIGRRVAIKSVRFDPSRSEEGLQRLYSRFEHEIQIVGTLCHPNIVMLYDVGQQDGRTFIAMEFVEGQSLRDEMDSRPALDLGRFVELVVPICDALTYAHERGVIHRDVKPTNILLTSEGAPKITDFGMARLAGSTLTQSGGILGAPGYMAPEQARGSDISGASDQYAVSVIVYEMLTGQRPIDGESPTEIIYKVIHETPQPPADINRLVPAAVSEVVMRGLAKNPESRYPSCNTYAEAFCEAVGSISLHAASPPAIKSLIAEASPLPSQARPSTRAWESATAVVRGSLEAARSLLADSTRLAGLFAASITLIGAALWFGGTSGEPASASDRPLSAGVPTGELPYSAAQDGPLGLTEDDPSMSGSARVDAGTPGAGRRPRGVPLQPGIGARSYTFTVTSSPPGAYVLLDGVLATSTTPATVFLTADRRHRLRLELEGFEPVAWDFGVADLEERHYESGKLHFPLTPTGRVVPNPSTPIVRVRAPGEVPPPRETVHVEPRLALSDMVKGVVLLEIEVSAKGNVVQARVVRGLTPALNEAALEAVIRRKYEPTLYRGEPVHVVMTIAVPFESP